MTCQHPENKFTIFPHSLHGLPMADVPTSSLAPFPLSTGPLMDPTDGSLPLHLPRVCITRALACAVPSYSKPFSRYLHGSFPQFIKVSAQRTCLRTRFPGLSEMTIILCLISLLNFSLLLKHYII